MPIRHVASFSHLNTSSKIENDDNNNQAENTTESPQVETSLKPNIPPNLPNPTENTEGRPLQKRVTSYSEILTERNGNRSVQLQQRVSEFFSSEQTHAPNENLRMNHQKSVKGANQISQKQVVQQNQLLLHSSQPYIEFRMIKLFWKY